MKPTLFVAGSDLAPIPFSKAHCEAAKKLKESGLPWQPHVGCFVWDERGDIAVPSPFPNRIYFILNIGRFLEFFDTVEKMAERLVWLPTWHQVMLLCDRYGIGREEIWQTLGSREANTAEQDVIALYELLLGRL